MKNTRTSREAETRMNDMLENYDMSYISPLHVPDSVKREGYDQAWVRKEVKGQDDFRVEEMSAKGWTPVPIDRAPSSGNDPLDRNPLARKFFTYKDLILMERPTIYGEREKRAFNELNANRLKSLSGVTNDAVGMGNKHNSISSF